VWYHVTLFKEIYYLVLGGALLINGFLAIQHGLKATATGRSFSNGVTTFKRKITIVQECMIENVEFKFGLKRLAVFCTLIMVEF
jgi:hypothetical protein